MVLLDRIELSASPLPRECSTTELQQRPMRPGPLRPRAGAAYGGGPSECQGGVAPRKATRLEMAFMDTPAPPPSPTDSRERRLAEALRANLRRRKEAARERAPVPPQREG